MFNLRPGTVLRLLLAPFLAVTLFTATSAHAQVVYSAYPNPSGSPLLVGAFPIPAGQMVVIGSGFNASAPSDVNDPNGVNGVFLNGQKLVTAYWDNQVLLVTLPVGLPNGSYMLKVQRDVSHVVNFEVAIDLESAGPAGATGAVGATGATGASGSNGAAGATGASGSDGAAGATGAVGATGASGSNGAAGATGATGAAGVSGADGATGASGADGAAGATGAASSVPGPPGAAGPTGAPGATGTDGASVYLQVQGTPASTTPRNDAGSAASTSWNTTVHYVSLSTACVATDANTCNVDTAGTATSAASATFTFGSATGTNQSYTIALLKNAATVLGSCTINANDATPTCTVTGPFALINTDTLEFRVTRAGTSSLTATATTAGALTIPVAAGVGSESLVTPSHITMGTATFNAGTTVAVALTGSAQFPSNNYLCTVGATSAAPGVNHWSVINRTATGFDLISSNSNSETVGYMCVGK